MKTESKLQSTLGLDVYQQGTCAAVERNDIEYLCLALSFAGKRQQRDVSIKAR